MKIKDAVQELRRFNFDFDCNITSIKQNGSDIIIKVKESKTHDIKEVKGDEQIK